MPNSHDKKPRRSVALRLARSLVGLEDLRSVAGLEFGTGAAQEAGNCLQNQKSLQGDGQWGWSII